MIDRAQVTAVIPTKGGYPLDDVLAPLVGFKAIHVEADIPESRTWLWNRFWRANMKLMAGIDSVFFSCDDDAIVEPAPILAAYEPDAVVCNMPQARRWEYPDGIALMGWGSVFDTSCLAAISRYLKRWPADELFYREVDRIFTALNRVILVDVPFKHLDRATAPDRMGQESRHMADLAEIRRRIAVVREGR